MPQRRPLRVVAAMLTATVLMASGLSLGAARAASPQLSMQSAGITGSGAFDEGSAAGSLTGRRFVAEFGDYQCPSIGIFAAATGRLLRVLRRHDDATLLTVGPAGKSLYYVNNPIIKGIGMPKACRATARREGTRRVLRMPLAGGRSVDTGRRGTSMAVSPDGRMLAWVTGQDIVRLHVWNRATGQTRRVLVADNHGIGNPTSVEGLAWAPDDTQLAVALGAAAAINWIHVTRPWTVRSDRFQSEPAGCATSCSAPVYNPAGHLRFLRITHMGSGAQLRIDVGGHSRVLKRLRRIVLAASIDPSGAALLTTLSDLAVLNHGRYRPLPDIHAGSSPLWIPVL